MRSVTLTLFLASALCLSAACSDDDDKGTSTPDTTTTPDTTPDAAPPAMISLSGTLTDSTTGEPLVGATVCFDEPADVDCITTDDAGSASVMLPANALLKVRITKEGYVPVLTFGNTEDTDIAGVTLGLLSNEAADLALAAVGLTRDDAKGHVLFTAATDVTLATKVEGVSASATASTGTQFYATPAGIPDTELSGTSSAGVGAIVNVDPGDYEVTFDHDSKDCIDGYAWPAAAQPDRGVTVQLPIEPGVMTFLSTYCTGGDAPAMITLSGTLTDSTTGEPLEGATVCFDEPSDVDCITTDASGSGSVMLPTNSLLKVRITKEGYMPVLTFGNTEESDISGVTLGLLSESAADLALAAVGLSRDDGKGHLLFSAATDVTLGTKVYGVDLATTATSGTQFYASAAGIPDTELAATTEAGAGALVNVDPGDYEATFGHPFRDCVDGYAWPAETQAEDGVTVQLPIEAGVMTFLSTYCNADMITLSGSLTDSTSGDPLEGATVCFDQPLGVPCITTDAAGSGSAMLPKNTLLKVRINKDGYLPVLTFGNTEESDLIGATVGLLSEAAADLALAAIGLTRDDTKGHLLFTAATDVTLQTKVEGVSLSSTAGSGTQFYATAEGLPDTALSATSERGVGALVNVDAGDYEATFNHASRTCVDGYAWPAASQPSEGVAVELPIEAGVMTFLSSYCN